MVNLINEWAQKIIVLIIICTIIEMILPEGKNKKYIKTVMGIYIVFIIISPIVYKIKNKSIDLSKYLQIEQNNTLQTIAPLDTNAYIEEVYIEKLKEDIKEELITIGFKVKKIELQIETKDEKNYGEILFVSIALETQKTENQINIEPIVVGNAHNNTSNILPEETNKIKKYLSEVYSINEDRIEVK